MCRSVSHNSPPRRANLAQYVMKAPIHLYRWTVRPWLGWPCRHLPTCSDYALEAIDRNGAWRGFWLTASRLARCHPFGSAGLDLVPDIRGERHFWTPWRYGRWTGRHIKAPWGKVGDVRAWREKLIGRRRRGVSQNTPGRAGRMRNGR